VLSAAAFRCDTQHPADFRAARLLVMDFDGFQASGEVHLEGEKRLQQRAVMKRKGAFVYFFSSFRNRLARPQNPVSICREPTVSLSLYDQTTTTIGKARLGSTLCRGKRDLLQRQNRPTLGKALLGSTLSSPCAAHPPECCGTPPRTLQRFLSSTGPTSLRPPPRRPVCCASCEWSLLPSVTGSLAFPRSFSPPPPRCFLTTSSQRLPTVTQKVPGSTPLGS